MFEPLAIKNSKTIKRQLLINQFLQDAEINIEEILKHFKDLNEFKKETAKKIQNANHISQLQTINNILYLKASLPNIGNIALINKALKMAIIKLLFVSSAKLEHYLHIHHNLTEEDHSQIDQRVIFKLLKNAIFVGLDNKIKLQHGAPELKILITMPYQEKINLFKRLCYAAVKDQNNEISNNIKHHISAISVLITEIIELIASFSSKQLTPLHNCIEQIIYIETIEPKHRLNFYDYVLKLNELKNEHTKYNQNLANRLSKIIRSTLEEDLISRFICLNKKLAGTAEYETLKTDLSQLKIELTNNHEIFSNLTNINFVNNAASEDTKKYLEYYINSNMLNNFISTQKDLEKFASSYFDIQQQDERRKYLQELIKLKNFKKDLNELIINDIVINKLTKFSKLQQDQRNEMFELCLTSFGGARMHDKAIAYIATQLTDEDFMLDTINNSNITEQELLSYVWDFNTTKNDNFENYINKLNILKTKLKTKESANKLVNIISESLKIDAKNLSQWLNKLDLEKEDDCNKVINSLLKNYSTIFDFDFTDLNEKAKKYITSIINKNNLSLAIKNNNLKKFIENYLSINKTNHDLSCEFFRKSDQQTKLKELIKTDILNNHANLLKSINEKDIKKLFCDCFGLDSIISALVAKIISSKLPHNEFVWRAFNWKMYIAWNFTDYIKHLKELRNKNPTIRNNVQEIIQVGLQEYLLNKYSCLRGE